MSGDEFAAEDDFTAREDEHEARMRFYDFLRSPRAAAVFEKYGFTWLAGK